MYNQHHCFAEKGRLRCSTKYTVKGDGAQRTEELHLSAKPQTLLPLAGNREAETLARTVPDTAQLAVAAGKLTVVIMKSLESVSCARGQEALPLHLALSDSDTHSSSPDSVQKVALGCDYSLARR